MRKRHARVVVQLRGLIGRTLGFASGLCPLLFLVKLLHAGEALGVVSGDTGMQKSDCGNGRDEKGVEFHYEWCGMASRVQSCVPCQARSNSRRSMRTSLPRSGSLTSTAASAGSTPTTTT